MGKSILVTGGARSGKSGFAERLTTALGPDPIYIATAQAHDSEMQERISLHQARRGADWRTVNAPLDVAGALKECDGKGPRLLDCLTLWLTNHMLAGNDWRQEARKLVAALMSQSSPVVVVTNEVGAGIVPENALARAFRDAAGQVNQDVAAITDEVYLVVSGQPLRVKPNDKYEV